MSDKKDISKNKTGQPDNVHSDDKEALRKKVSDLETQLRDLRKVESALRESEENFRDIFETVGEGIAYGTLRGKVISINTNLEKILELPREKIIGRNIMRLAGDLLTRENSDMVIPLLKDLVRGKPFSPFEVRYKNKILEVSISINTNTKRLTGTIRDVTERHRIQNELSVSEQRLRRAELASKSGNWELHLDTGIMYGSEGARVLYGVSEPAMNYETVKGIPLPEYRPMMDKALDDLIKHGKPYNIEFKIKKADAGEIIDIHSICEYDRERRILFGSIQDISETKRAYEVITRNNRDLYNLLRITMDLIETVDRKEVMHKIMEGALKITGLDTSAVYFLDNDNLNLELAIPPMDKDVPGFFVKTNLSQHPRIRKAVTSNTPVIVTDILDEELTGEEEQIIKVRNLRSLIFIPLMAEKKVVGILIMGTIGRVYKFSEREIGLSRTLTNIISLALENTMLFQNLKIAKERAEESDRLKTAFLHNISHEIRTPLNAIIGFSGFLDQPDVTADTRKEYIDIIFQSNNQLLSIINDILNISHIEAGQVILKINSFNVNRMIKRMHRQFMPDAEKKGLKLSYKCFFKDDSDVIYSDENKLIQVISNLVSNAIKFTDAGDVEFGYELKDTDLVFFVSDTGIGIPETLQGKIFERFYQVDSKVTRSYGGTGLGLSISKAYVELLGGRIWAESELNNGSVFYFAIPCSRSEPTLKQTIITQKSAGADMQGSKSILVAEDEDSNFALIKAMLKGRDLRIIRARNGKEAVEIFNSNSNIIMVLMDIKMPVMDGFTAASEMIRINSNIPIIVQTAYAHQSDRLKALETGCADYLAKPFNKNELLRIIDKYNK